MTFKGCTCVGDFKKNINLKRTLHQKNSCTRPLPKKIHARSVSRIKSIHVTRRKKYHAYTSREKNKSPLRERIKKKSCLQQITHTCPFKSQIAHSSVMGSKCGPRHVEFFFFQITKVSSFTRREW